MLFFLRESFNLWHLLMMIIFYYQIKTSIGSWCRRGLSPKSLIQPLFKKKKKNFLVLPIKFYGTLIFSAHIPGFLVHPCVTVGIINLQCITETITHDILCSCIKHWISLRWQLSNFLEGLKPDDVLYGFNLIKNIYTTSSSFEFSYN